MTNPTLIDQARLREAAINQNDAMRQELAHIDNLISDLARVMRVDLANEDGTWPNLAGRVAKLIDKARQALTETAASPGSGDGE